MTLTVMTRKINVHSHRLYYNPHERANGSTAAPALRHQGRPWKDNSVTDRRTLNLTNGSGMCRCHTTHTHARGIFRLQSAAGWNKVYEALKVNQILSCLQRWVGSAVRTSRCLFSGDFVRMYSYTLTVYENIKVYYNVPIKKLNSSLSRLPTSHVHIFLLSLCIYCSVTIVLFLRQRFEWQCSDCLYVS